MCLQWSLFEHRKQFFLLQKVEAAARHPGGGWLPAMPFGKSRVGPNLGLPDHCLDTPHGRQLRFGWLLQGLLLFVAKKRFSGSRPEKPEGMLWRVCASFQSHLYGLPPRKWPHTRLGLHHPRVQGLWHPWPT